YVRKRCPDVPLELRSRGVDPTRRSGPQTIPVAGRDTSRATGPQTVPVADPTRATGKQVTFATRIELESASRRSSRAVWAAGAISALLIGSGAVAYLRKPAENVNGNVKVNVNDNVNANVNANDH